MSLFSLNIEGNKTTVPIYIKQNIYEELEDFLAKKKYSSIFVIADKNTITHCLPIIDNNSSCLFNAEIIEIEQGEKHKSIRTITQIWEVLMELKADRNSLLINIGGGMISDIGGFVASTFHRGIPYINIPTTLMAQVDASIGNKTGINIQHIKNQVGTFYAPVGIFIDPSFLQTLKKRQLLSGMAEIFKHALISDKKYWRDIKVKKINSSKDISVEWIEKSIQIKTNIVEVDPLEKKERKALNFGHTIGHAIETLYTLTKKPLFHGEAIIIGMICEAFLSHKKLGLQNEELKDICDCFINNYPNLFKLELNSETILTIMSNDKKNEKGMFRFTLIPKIGVYEVDVEVSDLLIVESIAFYKSL